LAKKKKTAVARKIQLAQAKHLNVQRLNELNKLRVQLANVTKKLGIQQRKNTSLLSQAPDLFDIYDGDSMLPTGEYFVKRGPHGWLFRDGEIVSAFRLTDDNIVEQLDPVPDEQVVQTTVIKEIMLR